jgi:hypothetical protein
MVFVIAIIIIAASITVYISTKKSGRYQEARFSLIAAMVVGVLAISQLFTVVPAGTVGVVDFLGNVSEGTP